MVLTEALGKQTFAALKVTARVQGPVAVVNYK